MPGTPGGGEPAGRRGRDRANTDSQPTDGRCTMKYPKKGVLGALALVLGIVALGVWSDPVWAQETPKAGGELAYSVLAEPPSFDAHQEATFAVPHSTAPFYSLLVKFDPFEYPKIVPDIAESWTISPDGKVYEFKIRNGVKFHDGSALTSHDVK